MTTNPGEQSEVREPMGHKSPVLDIGEIPKAHIGRLELKLAEYVQRDRDSGVDTYTHPELAFTIRGKELFKSPILDYILAALQSPRRDLVQQPITLPEVATAIEGLFSFDLSASKTTDFLWNRDRPGTVMPDFEKLIKKGNEYDLAFSEVYAIIRAYCLDKPENIVGGTGLPELPAQAPEEE